MGQEGTSGTTTQSASAKSSSISTQESGTGSRRNWSEWDNTVPSYIRFFCFCWQIIKYMLQFCLCLKQLHVLNNRRKIPKALYGKLPPQTFERARRYQKDLLYLEIYTCFHYIAYEWWSIYHAGQTKLWFLAGPILETLGVWPENWDQETGETIIFIMEFILLGHVVALPIELWKNFVIEEKYGFNRMSIWSFFWEWWKVIGLESIWTLTAGVVILWIVKETGKLFFLYVWAFCLFWLLLSLAIYPNVVAPMFNDYTRLRDGRLRMRLHRLAHYIGFPLEDILVLHQNWKSSHRNAIFFGFGASKRIVLYDTLLTGYPEADTNVQAKFRRRSIPPPEEGESDISIPSRILELSQPNLSLARVRESRAREVGKGVVSRRSMYDIGFHEHEIEALVARLMGHWVMSHSLYELITPIISLFMFFFIFSYCYQASSLFLAFEVPHGMDKPIILGLRLLYGDVMDVYKIMVDEAMKYFARNRELEADSFATRLNYGEDLIEALIEMNKENLGFPYFDDFYWAWHFGEPSLLQRIVAIEQEIRRMEWRFHR